MPDPRTQIVADGYDAMGETFAAWREEIVGEYLPKLVRGGIFSAFALVDGRAAASWRIDTGRIEVTPFGRIGNEAQALLDADADAVLRYLNPPESAVS